jgi:hypothetical protein
MTKNNGRKIIARLFPPLPEKFVEAEIKFHPPLP